LARPHAGRCVESNDVSTQRPDRPAQAYTDPATTKTIHGPIGAIADTTAVAPRA